MKRKEELEVIIAAIARRVSTLTEHIGNGNAEDVGFLNATVDEMKRLIEYINELNELVPQQKIDVIFSDRLNELK